MINTVDLVNKDFSKFSLEIFLDVRGLVFGISYLPGLNKVHAGFGFLVVVLTFPVDTPNMSGLRRPVIRLTGSTRRG